MFWHWGFHVARRRKVAFEGTVGGLVFFHDGQSALLETKLQVLVTNPLTKKIKELPVLHHHMRKDAEVRVVPAEDGGYSLVAVLAHWCPVERNRTSVYVFHSRKENWFNGAPFPRRILSEVTLGPSLNGSIYCYEGQQGSLTIWRFNLKENKWSEVSIPAEVMQNLVSYQLVEQWGRLLMFAGCGEFTEAIKQLEGIKVWEVSVVNSTIERPSFSPDVESTGKSFAETTYRWNMLGEMEHKFFRDFCNSFGYGKRGQTSVLASLKFIHLVAADHCIYLSSKSSKFLHDSAAPLKNVALFDTLDRSWSWLTRPEVVLPYGYSSFCEAMSFVPRKTAVP